MEKKYYTFEEAWDMDASRATLRNTTLRGIVARALSKVPKEVVDRVYDECLFLMPTYEERGCFIPKELLRDKCIIALSEKLLEEDEKNIEGDLLHEVAHYYLGHKSPIHLSEEETRKQEEEADRAVDRWSKAFENDQAQKKESRD